MTDLKLKKIDHRWEPSEYWLGNDELFWVRIDFLLEYYISKNLEISKEYKKKLKEENSLKEYAEILFAKFMKVTLNGNQFNYDDYVQWLKTSNPEIKEVLTLFNS
jgi:hypothetical protein